MLMYQNFNEVINRVNSNSVKWDETESIFGKKDVLPMWIADLDFKAPEVVVRALKERVEHGIYGYTTIPNSTRIAIQNWVEKRHNWKISEDWISFSNGIVPAISTAIQSFTNIGDKIAILSPVYNPFFEMIEKNDRVVVHSNLQNVNHTYQIDFIDLAERLSKDVKMLILCNPHNPSGRVWKKDELQKVGEICLEHRIIVLSDEIHSDLVLPGNSHIPFASLSDDLAQCSITCIAPSKTFNLAGLQSSAIIIPNNELRERFSDIQQKQGFHSLNTFGIVGMETAYLHGEEWLEELLAYVQDNIDYTESYLAEKLPKIKMMKPEASYLIWLDCNAFNLSDEELKHRLLNKGRLAIESGGKYGNSGKGFVRMNIGCPKTTLQDGLNRLYLALQDI